MFDSYRFAAPDDLDDFGYEDETMDVQAEVSEYGPEDEDEDDLISPAPEPLRWPHRPSQVQRPKRRPRKSRSRRLPRNPLRRRPLRRRPLPPRLQKRRRLRKPQ